MSTALVMKEPQLPLAVGNLTSYIQAAFDLPMVSAEEEYHLALRLKNHNDVKAAERLVLSHLRFVIRIARDYRYYGLAMADLVQEGAIGLMKAVRRFDPDYGVRLASYAVHWIRAEIYEFILRNWRIVKVVTTKAQRKLFFNLHKMKKRLGWFTAEQIKDVANELGVKPKDVSEMEQRLSSHDQLYDPWSLTSEDDPSRRYPMEYMADFRYEPSETLEHHELMEKGKERLLAAINSLNPRAQEIIKRRWLMNHRATLEELGTEYEVSKERIRQIEADTLKKLRMELLSQV